MNLTDLQVAVSEKKIYTIGKRETVILINGVEASADELATLSSKEIVYLMLILFILYLKKLMRFCGLN